MLIAFCEMKYHSPAPSFQDPRFRSSFPRTACGVSVEFPFVAYWRSALRGALSRSNFPTRGKYSMPRSSRPKWISNIDTTRASHQRKLRH